MEESSHLGSIVELIQDGERPRNQIIELMDFPSTDLTEDSSLDDFPRTDVTKYSSLDDKLIIDAIDLISKLTEPILHHMLGFLQAQDTAPVAVLSKTWYQVWNTLPFIDFDGPVYKNEHGKLKPWLLYVDSILSHRKNWGVNVDKFRIGSGYTESLESYLDNWITTVTDLHVRDLCFCNYFYKESGYCNLPESIFSVKSINSLELFSFCLDSFQGMVKVNWPLLRKLHLKLVLLSDDAIHNIISHCRAIEDLNFEMCTGLKVIKISSLFNLQSFLMKPFNDFPKVEIDVPSLQSFTYVCAEVNYCFNIASCTRLQNLAFSGLSITQDWFDRLFSMFPLLESLTMFDCSKLVKINISSSKLKYFKIEGCTYVREANINTPNLSTFVYYGTAAIPWSLNASPQLQVNVVLCPIDYSKCPAWCTMVTNFLRMIGHFGVVSLGCHQQSLSFPKEIKDQLIYSQCDLKNLLLDFYWPSEQFTIHDAARLLDNLFWIYSQLENLSIYAGRGELPAIELLYKRLSDGQERLDCCDSVPIRCWRHFLKEVKFETIDIDEACRKGIYCKENVFKLNLKSRE